MEKEWYEKFSAKLWQVLNHSTEGAAKQMSDNVEESGVKGWMQMLGRDDQRQGADMLAEMARLIYTDKHIGKAKTTEQAKIKLTEAL